MKNILDFWEFLIFHDFSDFSENFRKSRKISKKLDFAWFPFTFPCKCKGKSSEIRLFRDFSKIFRKKIWKIMKNQNFPKIPKMFVILVLRVIDFCRLEIHWGAPGRRNIGVWKMSTQRFDCTRNGLIWIRIDSANHIWGHF